MFKKSILYFLGALVLFQFGCSNSIEQYHGTTIYDPEVLGRAMSFGKGKIVSAHDVQIRWKNTKNKPNQMVGIGTASTATEFVVEPDVGEPFIFVQYNEEQLKAGERVLLLEETGKLKIVRDRKDFFDKVAARENANKE